MESAAVFVHNQKSVFVFCKILNFKSYEFLLNFTFSFWQFTGCEYLKDVAV